ncbi:outer membrane beta-barrel protein [Parabacteroides bouchesdurhonensis]|uniref:outer membrane beta-barrel protein n=1 Tax=Parabacteroides bouchesdurhonensis TaxID=1936995 RepID=UPI000C82B905|nr:outer membrane beta-barrel protein [Parabacteroides bouchesdurhonensis]
MRKLTNLLVLMTLLIVGKPLFAQEKVIKSAEESAAIYASGYDKFRFGGYGEMAASYLDYGPNRITPNGSAKENRGTISIPRFVLALDYKFSPTWILGAEIEFEYGGTGSAREMEWRTENGEYETEIEKGGEVALEQFHITKLIHKSFNVRAGHLIVPVGLTNAHHEPINFFGVYRPEGETTILPSTWHENGISFFGTIGKFDYEAMLVTGLDPLGFSRENWIASGKQGMFEIDCFTSPAVAARLNYKPIKGLRLGASFYYNRTAKNASKPSKVSDLQADVNIFTFDAQYKSRNLIARGNAVYGNLSDSYLLNRRISQMSSSTGYSRTTVGKNAVSYAGEVGYNVVSLFDKSENAVRIFPFVRYEYYNTMEGVADGITADKRFQVSAFTAGVNYYALPNLVVKADYTNRQIGKGDFNSENMVSVGLAYIGWFLSK